MYTRRALLIGLAPRAGEGKDLLSSERGAAAVEYGLIGSLIAIVLTASLSRLRRRQRRNYNCIRRAMKDEKVTRFCKKRGG